jgi:hypothetical protein
MGACLRPWGMHPIQFLVPSDLGTAGQSPHLEGDIAEDLGELPPCLLDIFCQKQGGFRGVLR